MQNEPVVEGRSRFSLFAYGSLLTTGQHHDLVKPYLLGAQRAILPGTLHRRQDGYWTVRDVHSCWTGTMDRHSDIVRLSSTTAIGREGDSDFDLQDEIEGEVLYLSGGSTLLKRLDQFEGFRGEPGAMENEYLRVAIRVTLGAHQQACFCYVDAKYDPTGQPLPEGKVGRFLEL